MTETHTLGSLYDLTIRYVWDKAKDGEKSWKQAESCCLVLTDGTSCWRNLQVHCVNAGDLRHIADVLTRRGFSNATVNRYMAAFSRMLSLAEELEWIKDRPKWKSLKEGNKDRHILTREDEERLLDAFGSDSMSWRKVTRVLLYTAIRPKKELFAGTTDLDGSSLIIHDSKNGDDRRVPVIHLDTRDVVHALDTAARDGYRTYLLRFNGAKKRADLPNIQPYDLRHTAITRLIRAGVPLPAVQKWAGHRSINTTLTYVHMDQSDLEEAARKLKAYNDGKTVLEAQLDAFAAKPKESLTQLLGLEDD